jgi:hypothetical protein
MKINLESNHMRCARFLASYADDIYLFVDQKSRVASTMCGEE